MYNKEELISHIRKRPGMFIGALDFSGFTQMLEYFLDEIIEDSSPYEIQFEFHKQDEIQIKIIGIHITRLNRILSFTDLKNWHGLGMGTLIALTKQIKIWQNSGTEYIEAHDGNITRWTEHFDVNHNDITLSFVVDPIFFNHAEIHYEYINLFFQKFAYLNPGLKIISIDQRTEYQKNISHYPQGVKHQLDTCLAQLPYPHSHFRMDLITSINDFTYQISLCYTSSAYSHKYIRSYTNNYETYLGGSLVDGILEGIIEAIKKIPTSKNLKINKRNVKEGLALIASVKGDEFTYRGCTRRTLYMPHIKRDIKKYISEQVTEYLNNNPQEVDSIISKYRVEEDDDWEEGIN